VLHAIEKWEDCGLWANSRGEIFDGRVERIRFGAEDNEVERLSVAAEVFSQNKLGFHLDAAVYTDYFEAGAAKLCRTPGADQKGYVATGCDETCGEVAAYSSSSNNQNTHRLSLGFGSNEYRVRLCPTTIRFSLMRIERAWLVQGSSG
jgi:hypothetical protein